MTTTWTNRRSPYMEFTNTFTIPVGIDDAFAVLTDLEQVAPCMPGAKLDTVDGDAYTGQVKVKLGPMSLTYRGTAEIVEQDPEAHSARISARGNEARGGGTANADVTAELTEVDDGTEVVVTSNIDVTGKPAQFGRGVMADVGAKIIDTFADCLSRKLAASDEPLAAADADAAASGESDAEAAAAGEPDVEVADEAADDVSAEASDVAATTATSTAQAAAAPSGPRRVTSTEPEVEALDLMEVAGGATAKRLLPVAAAVVGIGLVVWCCRRRKA